MARPAHAGASVLHPDLVQLFLGDRGNAAPRAPAIEVPRPRADPCLEGPEVRLPLLLAPAEELVHVAGLAARERARAVVEPAHERPRIGPADEHEEVGIRIHT